MSLKKIWFKKVNIIYIMIINYKNHKIQIHSNIESKFLGKRCKAYENDEPFTIKWLESLSDNSILYDIGSNIGGFSFIATKIHPNIKIYSFEPNITNYYIQKNTCLYNNYTNINTLNIALNNENVINKFLMNHEDIAGGGSGTFGYDNKDELCQSKYQNPHNTNISYQSNTLALTLDFVIYELKFPVPNYIKLDVDGNESSIIKGATNLLKDPKLQEIIIEIDNEIKSCLEIYKILENNGFKIKSSENLGKNMKMICYSK